MSQARLSNARSLAQQALGAARRGDRASARRLLDAIDIERDAANTPWLLVGEAARLIDDDARASRAFTLHLERSPQDIAALLSLGAIQERRGDDRAASTFYRTALTLANLPGASPAIELVAMLHTAKAFLAAANQRFADHLERAIGQAGGANERAGARTRAAVDLLLGRSALYLQQPSMFYFPGLPQRAFYEREEFDWLSDIEAAVPAMREELAAMLAADDEFAPYVQRTVGRPAPVNPLLNDPSWGAQYLWRSGKPVEPTASRCPTTMAALSRAPIPVIAGRSPMALFSLLKPGTHIRPHHGLLNTRLICHVPLVAPANCGLRVGAETRFWRQGEALIFDDSFEHEAWNRSESLRVVLLFEIWRPEIGEAERHALTQIFEAIDTYQGTAIDSG